MVRSHKRDVQPRRVEGGSPSENERVDGVDHIRPETTQRVANAGVYGSKLYLGIGWEWHARDAVDRNPFV